MPEAARVVAWQPPVTGIGEVFHARFVEHSYPLHTHDTWTLLLVDDGLIHYTLDRREHGTTRGRITLLPPHVPHDGRTVEPLGFRKRVLYLDTDALDARFIGAAVDDPSPDDPVLRQRVHQLHLALSRRDDLEAQSRFALIVDRLAHHLRRDRTAPPTPNDPSVAHRLRDLLDATVCERVTLDEAAQRLGVHRVHLVRSFTREFGLPPHLYLTGRRVELARRRLLAGERPGDVAAAVGFYDQSHLTRHFKRMLGVSPGRFANQSESPRSKGSASASNARAARTLSAIRSR